MCFNFGIWFISSVPVVIASSAVGLTTCASTAGIEKNKSIIKKNRKKHNNIVLLAKIKLNTIKVLISKSLIDLYSYHDEFASMNNMLRQYKEMKKEIKNPENEVEYTI